MKKYIIAILLLLPIIVFAQNNVTDTIPLDNRMTVTTLIPCELMKGDTIVNLNSLNNGIIKYQVSKESKKVMEENGLLIKDGGVVIIDRDGLIEKNFSFDIKTFASDNEWYENTIKIQLKCGYIRLINITSDKIEMATGFRKEGKIYVVVAVSLILFFTVIAYLIFLERKVKKLEKMLKEK